MGRLRGCLWLTAGLVVALLAGVIAFTTLQRYAVDREAAAPGEQVTVVVAAREIPVRTLLTAEDLEEKKIPVDAAPVGAIPNTAQAIGKVTLVDLFPGEVLLSQRLVDPTTISGDGRLALIVAEDEVLMAFPAEDLMSRVGILKPGDHVDLLFSMNFPTVDQEGAGQEKQVTFDLLQNVTIAAVVKKSSAQGDQGAAAAALLLTVTPQDALILKYAMDAGGIVDIVLRPPGVDRPYEIEPVDLPYVINTYDIPNVKGR